MMQPPSPNEEAKGPSLPLIDFSPWTSEGSSDQRLDVAHDLVEACRRTGFVYISNHGIPPSLVEEAFFWSKKFFDLPLEDKRQVGRDQDSAIFRGYNAVGVQRVPLSLRIQGGDPDAKGFSPDVNETFDLGSEGNTAEPNKWLPEHLLPGFREFSTNFYSECWRVTQKILRALALGLGMREDFIERFHSCHRNALSYKHYPSVPASDFHSHEKERLGAHTDSSTLTLLFQDDCGGLEVETPGKRGEFVSADPIDGTLVMNIGDVLMRWSNVHRVQPPPLEDRYSDVNRLTRERFSMPYFVQPLLETTIECLPGCFDEKNPAKYPPRSYEELVSDYSKLFYPDATVVPGSKIEKGQGEPLSQ